MKTVLTTPFHSEETEALGVLVIPLRFPREFGPRCQHAEVLILLVAPFSGQAGVSPEASRGDPRVALPSAGQNVL